MVWRLAALGGIALLAEGLVAPPSLRPDDPAADESMPADPDYFLEGGDSLDDEPAYKEEIVSRQALYARGNSGCSGCDFTIDLSCTHHFEKRSGYWHRLADCLLPAYGLVEMARKQKGTVCILMWTKPPNIQQFMPVLMSDLMEKGARVINYEEPCVNSLTAHTVDPSVVDKTHLSAGEKNYMAEFSKFTNITGRYPIDWKASSRALHQDVARAVSVPEKRTLVLLDRENVPGREVTRVLYEPAKVALTGVMQGIAGAKGFEYGKYYGSETLRDTMRLFVNAAGIVGYHGAAFVNAVFTGAPSCVAEITPYQNNDNTWEWRTNEYLAGQNTFLTWQKIHIKFQTLVQVNGVKAPFKQMQRDKWIKHLKYVNLLDEDVAAVEGFLKSCVDKNAR